MAKWEVIRRDDGVMMMIHRNARTGMNEMLGEMRRDTPEDMIVDWVVHQNPRAGDVISMPSGRVALVTRGATA